MSGDAHGFSVGELIERKPDINLEVVRVG